MNTFEYQRKSKRLEKAAQLNTDQDNDLEQFHIPSNPCPSTSTDNSELDNSSDDDPSYKFSGSDMSDNDESSKDSFSYSNESHSALPSTDTFIKNAIMPESNLQIKDKLDKHEDLIIPNLIKKSNVKNEVSQASASKLEYEEVENAKKFHLPTYVDKKCREKKKTFCKFCQSNVTNFERHLERHHTDCKQVKEMMKYSKKSKKRRQTIQLVRNEGNFSEFLRGNIKPIYQTKTVVKDDYQPCAFCKGLYKKNFLYRHYKKCSAAAIHTDFSKVKHLSASQTLIASALDTNNVFHQLRVKKEVFGIMRADVISLVAKTDTLIYLYGERYLKKHKRKQMAVVCSNKMRELSRLLIEIRIIVKNDNFRLVDAIDPSMFEVVVECAKRLGGYNIETNSYHKSASLAAHYGTSLKAVCDLITYLIATEKKYFNFDNPEAKYQAVTRFKELISSQWTTEVSSLAFKDLNEKKWCKPVMLPLTKEIIKFKNYVTEVANKSVGYLKIDPNNAQEFKSLVNATLTLTILYNRKRIGDVQYTKLLTYLHNFSSSNQQEFLDSLSESEKILTKHYKRVVTGGKGSRSIVILFPQHLQDLMNIMIQVRMTSKLVPDTNEYLFAHPNSNRWVRADTVITKFAQKCGLEHPEHITSNRLRKQIATVMQILHLNQDDAEQFARFMGHTGKTHDEFYKLSEDVYQTAKISKLLILMDKGEGNKYKGKSLDEIDINPEVDIADSEGSDGEDEDLSHPHSEVLMSNIMPASQKPSTSDESMSINVKCRKQSGRTPWSPEQIQIAKKYFKNHIQQQKAPNKQECEHLKSQHPDLFHNKDWVRIKTFIYNTYRKKSSN